MGLGRGRKFVSLRFYLRISFPPSRSPRFVWPRLHPRSRTASTDAPQSLPRSGRSCFRPEGRFWRYPTTGYRPRSAGSARSAHTLLWGALALFIRVRAKSYRPPPLGMGLFGRVSSCRLNGWELRAVSRLCHRKRVTARSLEDFLVYRGFILLVEEMPFVGRMLTKGPFIIAYFLVFVKMWGMGYPHPIGLTK